VEGFQHSEGSRPNHGDPSLGSEGGILTVRRNVINHISQAQSGKATEATRSLMARATPDTMIGVAWGLAAQL
jgi:hypothetical protein